MSLTSFDVTHPFSIKIVKMALYIFFTNQRWQIMKMFRFKMATLCITSLSSISYLKQS